MKHDCSHWLKHTILTLWYSRWWHESFFCSLSTNKNKKKGKRKNKAHCFALMNFFLRLCSLLIEDRDGKDDHVLTLENVLIYKQFHTVVLMQTWLVRYKNTVTFTVNDRLRLIWAVNVCLVFGPLSFIKCQVGCFGAFRMFPSHICNVDAE